MSKRESIARYNLIINRLRKSSATLVEIQDYLAMQSEIHGYKYIISKRTFQRDIEDISSLYNLDISYDFSKRQYIISDYENSDIHKNMLDAFNVFNALNTARDLSNFIQFENRNAMGTEYLYGLLHAIKNKVQVSIYYRKFYNEDASVRIVEPYLLKEFRNRWYVMGKDCGDGTFKSFALDRITDLEISKTRFRLPVDVDVYSFYNHCFGIIHPEKGTEPQDIVLSIESNEARYIKALPLHTSQTIVSENEIETIIKLKVFITTDFVMEILSHGNKIKVLEPTILQEKIKKAM